MSSFKFRTVCAAAALTAALIAPALPSAVHAGAPTGDQADDYASARSDVKFAHVDFSDPRQVDAVYRRLKSEASYVCEEAATYAQNAAPSALRACEADAMAHAVHDITRPQLSRLDDEHNGKAPIELSQNSPQR